MIPFVVLRLQSEAGRIEGSHNILRTRIRPVTAQLDLNKLTQSGEGIREPSLTRSEKPVAVAAVSEVRITNADNFGVWPQRVRTPEALLYAVTAFVELQKTIHEFAASLVL